MSEHIKWPKTQRWTNLEMTITQKMDGTNGQLLFTEDGNGNIEMKVGARNFWLDEKKDNHKFYVWATENKDALYAIFGPGRHFGEWCGKGINTGEGLSERKFYAFRHDLVVPEEYQHLVAPVPLMYHGPFIHDKVLDCLEILNADGSLAVPGYMDPEGVVVQLGPIRYKAYCRYYDEVKEFAKELR